MARETILIVEDESDIRKLVHYNLAQERFRVLETEDGEQGLEIVRRDRPHLIVLDLMLPGLTGLEFCRILRESPETAHLPILMLTAKATETDRVVGLEMGADDYLTKPFSPRELVARVKAILRRTKNQTPGRAAEHYERGPLKVNFSTYEVFIEGDPVKLTLKEFDLLRCLVQNPNWVLSRDRLLDRVWGTETFVDPRTVDVHVRRLRKAIEKIPDRPEWILTVRGVGYKFDETALKK
ncbi:MAG: response regulator [Candidatus Binatia bacterium]